MTLRKKMAALLERGDFSLKDLSRELGVREKELLDHLEHVARSAKVKNSLEIYPAMCLKCGFVFKKRKRLASPSRCPKCRSERIAPPRFRLKEE